MGTDELMKFGVPEKNEIRLLLVVTPTSCCPLAAGAVRSMPNATSLMNTPDTPLVMSEALPVVRSRL